MICLNTAYSTTRQVTKQKPVIENKPDDTFESVMFLSEGDERQGEGGLRTQGYFKSSFPDKSLITVITVVFNGEQFLEETILSVINQTYDNVEYIIIDGGSTDVTLDIIRKYEHAIDYWVSERDTGVYNAMNKAIDVSLFEGWSSTVEECKSVGKNMILSDISIHKEQNPPESLFFNPYGAQSLSMALKKVWVEDVDIPNKKLEECAKKELKKRTLEFAKKYQNIVLEAIEASKI